MQVITAGSTALSKITTAVVAAFGGAAALGAAVLAFLQDDRNSAPLMLVLVGSVAAVLSATVLSIALIVRADLSARSAATSAEYRARAETAAALLQGFGRSRPSPAPEPRYWTKTRHGEVYPVQGLVLRAVRSACRRVARNSALRTSTASPPTRTGSRTERRQRHVRSSSAVREC